MFIHLLFQCYKKVLEFLLRIIFSKIYSKKKKKPTKTANKKNVIHFYLVLTFSKKNKTKQK